MQLPSSFLASIENATGFDRKSFEQTHVQREQITSIRINPLKVTESLLGNFSNDIEAVPWSQYGYYLSSRPSFTFDPLFHAGCYYVQEASSMFLEQALRQTIDLSKPIKVLDLCAAPGGKSTHIQSLIAKESLLVSNEVIRSRANVLKDNIIKWGCENVVVTCNDPKDFSRFENYFDVIVVDAPCSGSGLFRRDANAINEWSENNVQLCSQRQQRILADVWPALKKDGVLIYSTCSYSQEEDEDIMDWVTSDMRATNTPLGINPEWNIATSISKKGNYGYRFWPDKIKGEGFFMACFKKCDGDSKNNLKIKTKPARLSKYEEEMVKDWVKVNAIQLIKHVSTVYAWKVELVDDMEALLENLRVIYSGVHVGELVKNKMIPSHALALCQLLIEEIPRCELSKENAVKYLQRKEIDITIERKGWHIVQFNQQPIGWINCLSNRINNYYPKELRILKDG